MDIRYGSDRILSDKISLYELVRVIEIRENHILRGSPVYVENENFPEEIAFQEVYEKKCPLAILRNRTGNIYEYWEVNELHNVDNVHK